MCEYCGCRGVPPIGELMDEHSALVDQAHHIRHDLGQGDLASAQTRLTCLVADLDRHVSREGDGIFRAMRNADAFVEEIDALEGEHRDFASTIAALNPASAGFTAQVHLLLDDLDVRVEREDLGVFPVSAVALGATGWRTIDEAHARSPSFLHDVATTDAEVETFPAAVLPHPRPTQQ